jgi:NADH-quinone oxidoreductase subunit E
MLTVEERAEIEAKLADYPNTRAVCIEAMLIVQRHEGWVSDEKLSDLSSLLRLSIEELDGVATFYNLIHRRPVGRHVAHLCDSVSCWIMGSELIREALCNRLGTPLGGTTSDGQFTLLPIVCLGACDHAPAMMIDDTLYEDLDEPKLEQIFARYP